MNDDEISYRAREIAAERRQQEQDARAAALARQKELDDLNRRVNSFSVEIEALSAKFYTWATRYGITVEQFWSGSRWKSISGWKMAENTIHGDSSSKSYTSTTWQWIITTKGKLIRLTTGSYPSITESLHYDPSSPDNELKKTADLLAKIAADIKESIATRVADNPNAPWPP